ncbi:nuclear transport factor 2 family protein [Streptomyces sp. SYSU K217416]
MNDQLALRRLVDTYAFALDGRDASGFTEIFVPEGRLVAHQPDGALMWERSGAQELVKMFDDLSVFDRTFHLVANHVAEVDGDTATGTTYCLAHHYTAGSVGSSTDLVVPVRYEDTYARTADGWRIVTRTVRAQWYESRAFLALGA